MPSIRSAPAKTRKTASGAGTASAKRAAAAGDKPAPRVGTTTAKAAKTAANGVASAKASKPKLVRDSYTIPRNEYRGIEGLKARCESLTQRRPKKSELLRAGLLILAELSEAELQRVMQQVPTVKTGRPKSKPGKARGKATSVAPAGKGRGAATP